MKAVGSRAEVWHGTAHHTSGGLTKQQLKKNKHGRIVSKKMSASARKNNRLVKAGWVTTKGKFGSKKIEKTPKKSKKSKKKKSKKSN